MRTKLFLALLSAHNIFLCISLFGLVIFQTACNSDSSNSKVEVESSSSQTTSSRVSSWVSFDIIFKPTTNNETRNNSIKAIENLLLDSVAHLRASQYPNYYPTLILANNPVKDSLSYLLSVVNSSNVKGIFEAGDTTINKPVCSCQTNCGICNVIVNQFGTSPTYGISNITVLGQ